MSVENVKTHNTPFDGSVEDIIAEHRELTGRTRLNSTWWGKTVVEFEVRQVVTVDLEPSHKSMDLHQYIQRVKWIRA